MLHRYMYHLCLLSLHIKEKCQLLAETELGSWIKAQVRFYSVFVEFPDLFEDRGTWPLQIERVEAVGSREMGTVPVLWARLSRTLDHALAKDSGREHMQRARCDGYVLGL